MGRHRTKFVALRVSEAELETIKDAAFSAGVSVSSFVRDATLSAVIPPAGKHAAPVKHEAREESGADEQYADDLRAMSGELHPESPEETTQEISRDCRFVDTQDADDYVVYERLRDGVEQ